MLIYCVECNKDVEANLVKGNIIYPHRSDLYNLSFYQCPTCGGYVGTHKGTEKPLGIIPSNDLRKARIMLHNKMDKLWKSGSIKRKELYNILSKEMGYEYHNGNIKSIEESKKALKIIERIELELC